MTIPSTSRPSLSIPQLQEALRLITSTGKPGLAHECRLKSSAFDTEINPTLLIKGKSLEVATLHNMRFSSPYAQLTAEPLFVCPHQDLMALEMLNTPGMACPRCSTVFSKMVEDKNERTFVSVRFLGSYEGPPDRTWYNRCRLTGIRFSYSNMYWQVHGYPHGKKFLMAFHYRLRSRTLQEKMQGVHGQWTRDYCQEQKSQHQAGASQAPYSKNGYVARVMSIIY